MSTEYTKGPWYADINVYPIMIYSQSEMWPLWDEKGDKEGFMSRFAEFLHVFLHYSKYHGIAYAARRAYGIAFKGLPF